jgi:uncharacterized Ntn-hydrolase superfamily protein
MTFTVLAVEQETGLVGAATASYSLAVGGAAIAVAPDAGAVLSQAYTNRSLRRSVLNGLRSGLGAEEAVAAALASDEDPEYRQLAAIDLTGGIGTHTGTSSTAWAGAVRGAGVVAAGNFLRSGRVLDAMLEGYAAHPRPTGASWAVDDRPLPRGVVVGPVSEGVLEAFAVRLLAALERGERAGGDSRGPLSAAVQVAPVARVAGWPPDLALDLRSDHSADPLGDLGGMLAKRFAEPLSTAR